MLELKFGDICIVDLSRSINSPKSCVAPVIYMSEYQENNGAMTYRFCRVGKKPALPASKPFVVIERHPYLRSKSAIYPTQTVLFSDESAILSKVSMIGDERIEQEILNIYEKTNRAEKQAIVMCLCPRCRREFLLNTQTVMKRLDPYSPIEQQCDFCQVRSGHTYVIYKRRLYGGEHK